MRHFPSWLGLALIGLVSVPPVLATAQTVTKNDIAGAWVARSRGGPEEQPWASVNEWFLVLRADGTWRSSARVDGKQDYWYPNLTRFKDTTGNWYLTGDTLWFYDPSQPRIVRGNVWQDNTPRKVAIQNGVLNLSGGILAFPQKVSLEETCSLETFERSDTLNVPPTPKAKLLPLTLKPADFVGTWVTAGPSDTVTINPDSTWQLKTSVSDGRKRSGTWQLQPGTDLWPGDRLLLKAINKDVKTGQISEESYLYGPVTLQGNEFSVPGQCWTNEKQVYTRVKP